MPKIEKSYTKLNALKVVAIGSIIIYILGVLPQFTDGVKLLFRNPLMKFIFLALIVFTGYLDSTLGILLAIAFIVSYLGTPNYISSPVQNVYNSVREDTRKIIGGVSDGAKQLIGGVGSGAQNIIGGVGSGAQNIIGGIGSGTQSLIGGIGSESNPFISGAQNIVGNISGGAQQLIGGISGGAQQLLSEVQSGGQHILSGINKESNSLLGGNIENLENLPLSISQSYQQHMYNENGSDKGCSVQPAMETGCDPIVGYNASYNCSCNGSCGGDCKGTDPACLCKGVSVWKDELNAQGLNFPIGYSGVNVGSTY